MARPSSPGEPLRVLEARIWGERVGAVAMDPRLGFYAFGYEPKWREKGIELAPLQMPVTREETFVFPNLPEQTFRRLPAMLADALPDAFGNAVVDAWMAAHGYSRERVTALDRLAYMGSRGMGALEFRPVLGARREGREVLEMQTLVEGARRAVHGNLSTDALAESALNQIIQVGSSAGGARAKAVVAWNPSSNEIRSGQFAAPEGWEQWLLKFDGIESAPMLGKSMDYGRLEYAYHLMARAAGIEMAKCRLFEESGRAHFMTRRFDREGDRKHHIQTLCAMAHLDYKQVAVHSYEQAFVVMAKLNLGPDSRDELFRRMAFNVAAVNMDDHTKNISFILRQGHPWTLAPAYDVTFSHDPKSEWVYQHQMSANGKFVDIGRSDLLAVADRFQVRDAKALLERVNGALDSFPEFANTAGLRSKRREEIRKHFRRV